MRVRTAYPSQTNSYAFLANGLLTMAANETGTLSNRYDSINRLVAAYGNSPSGTVHYGYFPAGQVSNVTFAAGAIAYSNDAAERVSRIVSPEGAFGYTYNLHNGSVATVSNGAGRVDYSYDIMDQLTEISYLDATGGVAFAARNWYDGLGMITQRQTVVNGMTFTETYEYDSLDRLVGDSRIDATGGVVYANSYGFDLTGNRTNAVVDGTTQTYTLGIGNRLASWGAAGAYTHAASGCVTSITRTAALNVSLQWNDRRQLTGVATNGAAVARYGYDALGRRAWTFDGSVTNGYVFDGIHVIAEVDATGELLKSYTWGPGIDNLLAFTDYTGATPKTYRALTDHLGSVHALMDSSGAVVESYMYDAWGRVLGVYDGSGNPLTESAVGNHYLWQGRWYSWDSGLYYFRARWYDPNTGRWLSKDPIGISGGLNQFVFGGGDPVNFVDPFGLATGWFNKFREAVGGGLTVGPIDAYRAGPGEIGDWAWNVGRFFANRETNPTLRKDVFNAARHVAWQASLTQEFGSEKARRIGDLHELGDQRSKNPGIAWDSRLDQSNNILGRQIGSQTHTLGEIIRAIEQARVTGQLVTGAGPNLQARPVDTSYDCVFDTLPPRK